MILSVMIAAPLKSWNRKFLPSHTISSSQQYMNYPPIFKLYLEPYKQHMTLTLGTTLHWAQESQTCSKDLSPCVP